MRLRTLCALLLVTACDGDRGGPAAPGEREPAALQLLSGEFQRDTVFAGPADSLVVRVVDEAGDGVPGVPVRFEAGGERWEPRVFLLQEGREFSAIEDTTDAAGRVAVQVAFGGPRAGYAWVEVKVPALGTTDSAFYEVLPGAPVEPAHGIFPPRPLTVVGESVEVRAVSRDQHGNNVTVPPTSCTTGSPSVDVTPPCVVEGIAFGNAEVTLRYDDFQRGFTLPVFPRATFAFPTYDGVVVAELGGPVLHRLPFLRTVEWAPAGDRLVGERGGDFTNPGHLFVLTLGGELRELIPAFAGSLGEEAPIYSADGRWVYFQAWGSEDRSEIWRVPSGGGTPERVGPAAAPSERDRFPSPSPDGTAVVFAHDSAGGASELRILDLATRQVRPLGVAGTHPRWSPAGEWIAFLAPRGSGGFPEYDIARIQPDGTDLNTLEISYGTQLKWSPDGRYLVVSNGVMDAATGEVVYYGDFVTEEPIGSTSSGLPAWRP